MGRQPKVVTKSFEAFRGGDKMELEVELFPWEKLDRVNEVKKEFGL